MQSNMDLPQTRELPPLQWVRWISANSIRLIKSGFGIAVLAVAVWAAYRSFFLTISDQAVVSAEFITLRAPIEGFVRLDARETGKVLNAEDVLGRIENPLYDHTRLAEVQSRLDAVNGNLRSLTELKAALTVMVHRFDKRGTAYRVRREQQLRILMAQLEARAEADRARLDEVRTRAERVEQLVEAGIEPAQAADEVRRDKTVTEKGLAATDGELESVRASMTSLREGISLDAFSGMDRSYSNQRSDEVSLRLTQVSAEIEERAAERDALLAQIEQHKDVDARRTSFTLRAPQRSRVWSLLTADDEYVSAGHPLARLVSCARTQVIATVNERNYNRLHVGDRVEFELDNADRRYSGHVAMLLGSSTARVDPGDRASPLTAVPTQLLGRHTVVVASDELASSHVHDCELGQAAEIRFFPSRRRWWFW